jgi:hypothetical protein
MPTRIVLDEDKPSATIEIPLEKPLPDYGIEQLEYPTPRQIDGLLVSPGFRDLVDDGRGVLTELLGGSGLEIAQFTGAICPSEEDVYRPGLWIVLMDARVDAKAALPSETKQRISRAVAALVERLQLD